MKKQRHHADSRPHLFRAPLAWARITLSRLPGRKPKDVGVYGEDLARWELERRGYRIIDRRVRNRLGEIDIVAWDGRILVFVEVKTRTGRRYGSPWEAVDRRKQKKLIQLARIYLARRKLHEVPIRFDIVGVELIGGRKPTIRLFQGAFDEE